VDYSIKSKILFHCLSNVEPLQIQQQAIEQLSKLKNKEIGWEILKLWPELSPQTRKLAGDLLLSVESNHDALLSGLEKKIINIGEMNFDLERRRTLLWWTSNADTRKRAAKLFSDAGVQTRKDAIESMKPALELVGTPEAGKKVFMNICSNCHQFKNWGVAVGPVLTEISRKSKATLLHEILDPNSNVDTKYINHRVELNDGKLFTGIISSETDTRLVITMVGGSKQTILKNQIKKLNSLGTSLMMEGLESAMSKQEMADLLAFIRTQ
jgi:putative heme-binding domain-containing protein